MVSAGMYTSVTIPPKMATGSLNAGEAVPNVRIADRTELPWYSPKSPSFNKYNTRGAETRIGHARIRFL
jgi:hypothetical protein